MAPLDYFSSGDLNQALTSALAGVKAKPQDLGAPWVLCEMLCFSGELDRVDKHLDLIGEQDPEAMPGVSLFRQLLRAAVAREQFYSEGRLPELLGEPPADVRLRLEASTCLRGVVTPEGAQKALELLTEAEAVRPRPAGTQKGQHFDDIRDLDDLTASVCEVLTSTGKYYWVPLENIRELELRPAKRTRDLIWRPARMVVANGPNGEVYIPALYSNSSAAAEPPIRLGRATDWVGEGEIVRGIGQKMFLVGEEACGIADLSDLTFDLPVNVGRAAPASPAAQVQP